MIRSPEGNLLIDTPPELRIQLLREGIDLADAVLYTHHHADHIFGLDDVRAFAKRLQHPLPVYCDPATEEFIRTSFRYIFDPIVRNYPAGGVPNLELRRIDRPSCRILDHDVVPIPLRHGRYDTLGFRFGGLAFCTDVNFIPEESWRLLEGVEILILDALRFDRHSTHFTFDEALEVVERLGPRKAYFTHISCQLDPARARERLPPNVELAYDGLKFLF
jgi:phosphoribosyl 1,2-cyclic phosphate phosphodiesterase